jgi:hypothetical protein
VLSYLTRLLVCAAVVPLAIPADARVSRVLVGTDVSGAAQATMSPRLWARLVVQWVGQKPIPFSGKPTLYECAHAKALYMVYAPFELRPQLPGGSLQVRDRITALTHITVVNCLTKATTFDQIVGLTSNPTSTAGDVWASSVAQTLRRHRIVFSALVHVVRVTPPFVMLSASGGIGLGQTLRVYASRGGTRKNPPVILTVTAVFGREVEARYDARNPRNKVQIGDRVEPYAAMAPAH